MQFVKYSAYFNNILIPAIGFFLSGIKCLIQNFGSAKAINLAVKIIVMNLLMTSIVLSQTGNPKPLNVLPDKTFLSSLKFSDEVSMMRKTALPEDTKQFYVINFEKQKYDTVLAVLKLVTENAKIWVDTLSLQSNYVSMNEVYELAFYIESVTYENSKNRVEGIFPLMKQYFGMPPNVDNDRNKNGGDGRTNILITDIHDGLDNTSEYIPGYFNFEDVDKSGIISNKMDLIYLDSKPGIYYKGFRDAKRILSTVAHEFQHLIHWNYDPDECSFMNESMSILAEFFCGFKVDLPEACFTNTNIPFFDWSDENHKINESRAALFGVYLREQCGDAFIKYLIAAQDSCIKGIDSALMNAGISQYSFEKLYMNWAIANYVNDKYLDSRYGYNNKLFNKPVPIKTHSDPNVLSNFVGVGSMAPIYIKYSMAESLAIVFHYNQNVIVKALEIGNSNFKTYDISAHNYYVQNNLGSLYKEIVFVCLNLNKTANQTEFVNYVSSGKKTPDYTEIAYDDGNPENYGLSGEPGVKRFVKFRLPAGKQLDSVKIGFKSKGRMLFHIYRATDTSILAVDNIISPLMVTVTDTFPVWTKIDLTPFKIVPDFDIAAGYELLPGDAPHPYIWGDNSFVTDRSIVYFPSTGAWHPININYLVRVYMSNFVVKVDKNEGVIPESFKLYQNYPNPFNGATTIKFDLNNQEFVKIKIYDLLGKEVATLVSEPLNSGSYTIRWDGKNKYAVNVPSGLYIYCLETSKNKVFKKMVYLR